MNGFRPTLQYLLRAATLLFIGSATLQAQGFEFTEQNLENVEVALNEHLGNEEGGEDWVDIVTEQPEAGAENEWWVVLDNFSQGRNPGRLGDTGVNSDGTTFGTVVYGFGCSENFPTISNSPWAAEEILLQVLIHEHGHAGSDVGGGDIPHKRDDEPGPDEEEPVRVDHCLHIAQLQGDAARVCGRICDLVSVITFGTSPEELEEICLGLQALCDLHKWLADKLNGPRNSDAAEDCPEVNATSSGALADDCDCCDLISDLCCGSECGETDLRYNDYPPMPN